MTLARQLTLGLSWLLMTIFIGVFTSNIANTRSYLQEQLGVSSQDTATSLGLSLTTALATHDLATLQSMVDAVFDRGYYQSIKVEDNQGKLVYERTASLPIENVPFWFIAHIPLDTPEVDSPVMSGWNQAGTLRISGHPGYAYLQLWQHAKNSLLWFFTCTVLTYCIGAALLRFLLKPLKAIEAQALAICEQQYPTQKNLPYTQEFRQVVIAMNRMAMRVSDMFKEQSGLASQLRAELFQDTVTGLGNRRHFMSQLSHLLEENVEFAGGLVLLLQLRDFKHFNDRCGYQAGDRLLLDAGRVISSRCRSYSPLVCRLGGADFAVLMAQVSEDEVKTLAESLLSSLSQIAAPYDAETKMQVHIGLVPCRTGQDASHVLAAADHAMRNAQHRNLSGFYMAQDNLKNVNDTIGATKWRERIEDYLANDRLVLQLQPVIDSNNADQIHHFEVFLRAREEAQATLLTAGAFLSMAQCVDLSVKLDRWVVEQSIQLLERHPWRQPLALNLSTESIGDEPFLDWLETTLESSGVGKQLIFEAQENTLLANRHQFIRFACRYEPYGTQVAIDHYGSQFIPFENLLGVKIAYTKLDGSLTKAIPDSRYTALYLRALTQMAHEVGIRVIATSVESEQQAINLRSLHVDGLQGRWIGKEFAPMDVIQS